MTGAADPEPIRVLIADDQATFRTVVRTVLEQEPDIEVVAEAADGEEAIALATEHAPNVVLMDIRMPKLSGIEAARVLNDLHPTARILMLTSSDDETDLFGAIRAGASGYLLKDSESTEVVRAVRRTHSGQAVLSENMATTLLAEFASYADGQPAAGLQLTRPEVRVLQMMTSGLPTSEVADRLGISQRVVHAHLLNLLTKLHVMGGPPLPERS